ncbi:O-antigen ligase family protein [uncultured Flavobacterium sp.]|uniref:O-antigen ligase family protein n=1 Tax=uncultured Flavobacterium sp. TaxID=165435 RepID=UPI0025EE723E|nr:O-antigen ligase family protein [uncultured Flavobacterium sp.]
MKSKKFLLRLLIMSIPFNEIAVVLPQVRVPTFVFFLYLIVAVPAFKHSYAKYIKVPLRALIFLYLALFITSYLNFFPGYNFGGSFLRQLVIYILFFYFITIEFIKGTLTFAEILKAYNNGLFIFLAMALVGIDTTFVDGRLSIMGTNANLLGVFCVSAVLITTHLFMKIPQKSGNDLWLFFFKITALLAVIASTGSRGAFISLMVAVGIYIIFQQQNTIKRFQYTFVAALVLGLLSALMLSSGILAERFFAEDEDLAGSRTGIWTAALQVLGDNYLTGVGLFAYQKNMEILMGRAFAVHNEFLAIFIYSGIIGFSFFIFFVKEIVASILKFYTRFKNPVLVSLMFGVFFTMFKGGGVFMSINTWFFFSLAYASKYYIPKVS